MTAGRFRPAIGTAAAAGVALVVALVTPMTHGAFSATVGAPGQVALNPWFGCHALAAGTGGMALFAYGLDDGEGATGAADLSGNGHTGTYSAAAHFGQDRTAPCRRDGDVEWLPGGTTDLVTASLPLPTNFSYETWFRTASPNRVLMSIEIRYYGSVALAVDANGGLVLAGLGTEFLHVPASVADDTWHHLVMNAGNGTLAFWLDGTMIGSDSLNVPDGLTVVYHIGTGTPASPSSVSSAQPFDGALRYAALYSAVLAPNEVAQHRAAGRARPVPVRAAPGPDPTLTATPDPAPTSDGSGSAAATPAPSASAVATAAPQPDQSAQAAQSAKPVQSAPADSGGEVLVTPSADQTAEPVQSADSAQPADSAQTADSAQSAQPAQAKE